ncbi:hypothetical protein C6A85_86865, partial [Mycobacterium sp. ITM-2017-0098]
MYATDSCAARLDELQYTLGEGPCFDAYRDASAQFHPHVDSVTRTSRWPTFAGEVVQLGVHSLFAFPVPGPRGSVRPSGVLELYRRRTGSLTDAQQVTAAACVAAIAQRLQSNWNAHAAHFGSSGEALDAAATAGAAADDPAEPFTRNQVHVAAGIVAVQLDIDADEAVDRLRAHSFAAGCRLSSVAADVIAHRLTLHD